MTTDLLITEALEWLEDCFEDLPADLTNKEIINGIQRHYEGGWTAFVEAGL